jgi:predicted nucleic acid-binding protein
MAQYFLESSALAKRYKQETGTNFVNSLFLNTTHELFYLNLGIIEVRKILYRLWKYPQTPNENPISEEIFKQLMGRFSADIQRMNRIVFTEEMIDRTANILEKQWLKSVFDLAHLSAYLITAEEYPKLVFVCSDNDLINAAAQFVRAENIIIPERTETISQ